MELKIIGQKTKQNGSKVVPSQFNEAYHPSLIKRAVHSLQSKARQSYGTDPKAGMRHSSELSKRRRKYRGCYGFGISRVNRKILSRRGTRFFWVGATSPQTVGGRRSHPPKSDKIWAKKINRKENRKAIRSAMSATLDRDLVSMRGHNIPEIYPFILSSDFEKISRTSDLKTSLIGLGFKEELTRSEFKKVRAGVGKSRGRKYNRKKSLLIVVAGDCPLINSARNLPGIEVVVVNGLNCNVLAPGASAGRVTLWSENAIKKLEEEKLFQ